MMRSVGRRCKEIKDDSNLREKDGGSDFVVGENLYYKNPISNRLNAVYFGSHPEGFVISNILQMNGSLVVDDPSGMYFDCCSGSLKDAGYKIMWIDSEDWDSSWYYNPISSVCNEDGGIDRNIINNMFRSGFLSFDHAYGYWPEMSKALFYSLVMYMCIYEPKRKRTLFHMQELLTDHSFDDIFSKRAASDPNSPFSTEWRIFKLAPEETQNNIIQFMLDSLKNIDAKKYHGTFSGTAHSREISLSLLWNGKTAVFAKFSSSDPMSEFLRECFWRELDTSIAKAKNRYEIPLQIFIEDPKALSFIRHADDFTASYFGTAKGNASTVLCIKNEEDFFRTYKRVYKDLMFKFDIKIYEERMKEGAVKRTLPGFNPDICSGITSCFPKSVAIVDNNGPYLITLPNQSNCTESNTNKPIIRNPWSVKWV